MGIFTLYTIGNIRESLWAFARCSQVCVQLPCRIPRDTPCCIPVDAFAIPAGACGVSLPFRGEECRTDTDFPLCERTSLIIPQRSREEAGQGEGRRKSRAEEITGGAARTRDQAHKTARSLLLVHREAV